MGKTEKETLKAEVSPKTATNKTITWSSSDNSVVKVNSQGTLTPLKFGTATITAKSNNNKVATCRVDVQVPDLEVIPATGIRLNTTNLNLEIGTNATLEASVLPFGVSNRTVTWSSSDESIATVDEKGVIRTLIIGTTTITAKTHNNKKTTCIVKVVPVPVKKVKLDTTSISLIPGNAVTIKAEVSPKTATNKALTWNSSNPAIATVTNGNIKAGKTIGTTTITVTSNADKTIKATCIVKVTKTENATTGLKTITRTSTALPSGDWTAAYNYMKNYNILTYIIKYANEYKLPADLVMAVIYQESRFNPSSNANNTAVCVGLMQVNLDYSSLTRAQLAGTNETVINNNIKAGCSKISGDLNYFKNKGYQKYELMTILAYINGRAGAEEVCNDSNVGNSWYVKSVVSHRASVNKYFNFNY